MRQVQARAVRQECAEGVEEVVRGGLREGRGAKYGWFSLTGNKKEQFPRPPTTVPLVGVGGSR